MYNSNFSYIYSIKMDMPGGYMMWYIFWFLLGFGLTTAGGVTLIIYLNILPLGVTMFDYFLFVLDRPECYLFPIGILVITLTVLNYPSK
jgi:hypothetical protein